MGRCGRGPRVLGVRQRPPQRLGDAGCAQQAARRAQRPGRPVHAQRRRQPWDLLLRTVYRQFGWHSPIFSDLARFGAILDRDFPPDAYERLSPSAPHHLLGAPLRHFHAATFLFTVAAQRNQGLCDLTWFDKPHFEPVTEVVPAATIRQVFRQSFTAPLADLAARARAGRNADPELRVNDFNPLVATPCIGLRADLHVAPLPRLVADKASLTSLYHQGRTSWGDPFTRDLGRLVEAYAGEQLAPSSPKQHSAENGSTAPARSAWTGSSSCRELSCVEVKSARVAQPSRLALPAFLEDVAADVGKSLGQITRTAELVRAAHPAFDDIPCQGPLSSAQGRPLRGLVITADRTT